MGAMHEAIIIKSRNAINTQKATKDNKTFKNINSTTNKKMSKKQNQKP
jgi:hypothetical protein